MSRLPLELYNYILSSLQEDRKALKALSLSWRVLTPLSQRHLFHHIILRPPWQCIREYHDVCGSASAFRQLLDTSPHIGEYVRTLEVCESIYYGFQHCNKHATFKRGSYSWFHNGKDLPSCLTRLTNLQALVMLYISHDKPFSQALLDSIYQTVQRPSLVHLELAINSFLPVLQHSRKNLKHLILHTPIFYGAGSLDYKFERSGDPVVLHSLCCTEWANNSVVAKALLDPGSGVSLQGLKRLAVAMEDFEESHDDVAKHLRVCHESLEDLMLRWHSPPEPHIESSYYLHHFPSLKRFHISLVSSTDPGDEGLDDEFPWFINFLKQSITEGHPLEELSIEQCLYCDGDEIAELISDVVSGWKEVTSILLKSAHFPMFQALKLRIYSDMPGLAAGAVEFLERCDFFKEMKARLPSSVIFAREQRHCIMADFVANPIWLSIEDRDKSKQSRIAPPFL